MIHVVICRYKENATVIQEVIDALYSDNYKIFVYDRGEIKLELKQLNCLNLIHIYDENIGREEAPYLTHIVKNYHTLPEKIIFSQASIIDHKLQFEENESFSDWISFIKNTINLKFNSYIKKREPYYKGQYITHASGVETILKFIYKNNFNYSINNPLMFQPAAIFAVSKNCIKNHDLSVYETLLGVSVSKLNFGIFTKENITEFPWAIERCWETIFSKYNIT